MNDKKDILLKKYYQKMGDDNKITYLIFPKLIYDDKFFEQKYKPSISFAKDNFLNLVNS